MKILKNNQNGFAASLVILITVFILVIIAGLLIFGGKREKVEKESQKSEATPTVITNETAPTAQPTLSSSDSIKDIENDLDNTDTLSTNPELKTIEDELPGL